MAITVTRLLGPETTGASWRSVSTVLCDNSYVTGGYPLSKAQLGFAATTDPAWQVDVTPSAGYIAEYDHANSKLKLYRQTNPAAVGGADVPLVEVANAFDVSAVTVRVEATGKFRL